MNSPPTSVLHVLHQRRSWHRAEAPNFDGGQLKSAPCGFVEAFLGWSRLPVAKLSNWVLDLLRRDRITDNANRMIELAARFAEDRGARFMLVFLARPMECLRQHNHFDIATIEWPHASLLDTCPKDPAIVASPWFTSERHWTAYGHVWAARILADLIEIHNRTYSAVDLAAAPSR